MTAEAKTLVLPITITTQADLSRAISELEALDNFLRAGAIRQPGTPMQLPKTSKFFEDLVNSNKLNMLLPEDRESMIKSLAWVRLQAPILHVSFSVDPSTIFLEKLTTWLRQNISPLVLVQVGLRPNIGAGCVLRTTNKHFDLSLRQRFLGQREMLMKQLNPVPAITPAMVQAAEVAA